MAVVYGRWSLTRGGRTWRFDCINSGGSRPSDKGGGGGAGHPDHEIRRGRRQKIFPPFGPQFGLKIRGGAEPPGPLPWIRHRFQSRSQGSLLPVPREPGNEAGLIHDSQFTIFCSYLNFLSPPIPQPATPHFYFSSICKTSNEYFF